MSNNSLDPATDCAVAIGKPARLIAARFALASVEGRFSERLAVLSGDLVTDERTELLDLKLSEPVDHADTGASGSGIQ